MVYIDIHDIFTINSIIAINFRHIKYKLCFELHKSKLLSKWSYILGLYRNYSYVYELYDFLYSRKLAYRWCLLFPPKNDYLKFNWNGFLDFKIIYLHNLTAYVGSMLHLPYSKCKIIIIFWFGKFIICRNEWGNWLIKAVLLWKIWQTTTIKATNFNHRKIGLRKLLLNQIATFDKLSTCVAIFYFNVVKATEKSLFSKSMLNYSIYSHGWVAIII